MNINNNTESDQNDDVSEAVSSAENKPKAHIIRRNVEDYLEQKALERRISDVFDERVNFGW